MDEKIDKALESLLTQAFRPGAPPKSDDAVKYSQAVLNLTHAKSILSGRVKSKPSES